MVARGVTDRSSVATWAKRCLIAVAVLLVVALYAGVWAFNEKWLLRDDYRNGYTAGQGIKPSEEEHLFGFCRTAVKQAYPEDHLDAGTAVPYNADVSEAARVFWLGCSDAALGYENDPGNLRWRLEIRPD